MLFRQIITAYTLAGLVCGCFVSISMKIFREEEWSLNGRILFSLLSVLIWPLIAFSLLIELFRREE